MCHFDDIKDELDKICLEEDLDAEFDSIVGSGDKEVVLTSEQFKRQHDAIKRWVSKCQDL